YTYPSCPSTPGGDQAAPVAVEPPTVQESRKKGREGIDANAPPKSLRRDHADLQPSGVPADVSDPDPLAFADAPSPHHADVIRPAGGDGFPIALEVRAGGQATVEVCCSSGSPRIKNPSSGVRNKEPGSVV
nr:hypothetical protein [Tanacetum cinerariifolium]